MLNVSCSSPPLPLQGLRGFVHLRIVPLPALEREAPEEEDHGRQQEKAGDEGEGGSGCVRAQAVGVGALRGRRRGPATPTTPSSPRPEGAAQAEPGGVPGDGRGGRRRAAERGPQGEAGGAAGVAGGITKVLSQRIFYMRSHLLPMLLSFERSKLINLGKCCCLNCWYLLTRIG